MTTAELIESHLGPGWVTAAHDDTALLSLLDRIMEEFHDPGYEVGPLETARWRVRCEVLDAAGWRAWVRWHQLLNDITAHLVPVS